MVLFTSDYMLAQNNIAVKAEGIYAFQDHKIVIYDIEFNEIESYGFALSALYQWRFENRNFTINTGAGYKSLKVKGHNQDKQFFEGHYSKMNLILGGQFEAISNVNLGADLIIENNRDFKQFGTYVGDLWRYYLRLNAEYHFHEKWAVFANYSRLLKPYDDVYLLMNAPSQIGLGIKFNVL